MRNIFLFVMTLIILRIISPDMLVKIEEIILLVLEFIRETVIAGL